MHAIPALALLSLASLPTLAGETPWQEIAPGVDMRLVSSGEIRPDGTTLIGLEINMPSDTKTYWRVPGDTGLPTELDFSGSPDVEAHAIHWPFPIRDQTAEYLDYVYYGPTVLPVELELAPGAQHLELAAVLGICSEICIPAQARFSMPLESEPDRPNGLRLKQAIALAPIAWPDEEPSFGEVSFDPTSGQLLVPVLSSAIDIASLIVTAPGGEPLYGTPQKSREPNLVVVPVLGERDEIDWSSQSVQLTFMTDMGSFEVSRPIKAAANK